MEENKVVDEILDKVPQVKEAVEKVENATGKKIEDIAGEIGEKITEAVKEKKFHVYAVDTIDEGIEILTGVPAGSKDTPGTINYLVYNTLKKFAKQSN